MQSKYASVRISEDHGEADSTGCDLVDAVTRKDAAFCRSIINAENVNSKYEGNTTLLHIIAKKYGKKKKDLTLLLLEQGINYKAKDKDGNTPLHIGATEGHVEFCKDVINYQRSRDSDQLLDITNSTKMTPLHLAAHHGKSEVVSLLLKEGANATLRASNRYLPLHYAAASGHHECCELLAHTYPTDDPSRCEPLSPLMLAAKGGYEWCFKKFILSKKDLNWQDKHGNTPLLIAAKRGFDIFVAHLIKLGADLDIKNKAGNTPVMEAITRNSHGLLTLLVNSGANLSFHNKENKGVLHLAAEKKAEESMNLLLSYDSIKNDIDKKDRNGCTPLLIAIKKDCDKCAFMLLEAGASPHEMCNMKFTPLHFATQASSINILNKLLRNKAVNVNATNKDKLTPLHLAAEKGTREACIKLLRRGACIEATDKQGRTALHLSAIHGHSTTVKLLIRQGAHKRAVDDNKLTPLHIAADTGNLECCKILTEADPQLCKEKDSRGRFPVDIAFHKGHTEVAEFLLKSLTFKNNSKLPSGLAKNLHSCTHQALKEENRSTIEIIIESRWWEICFISSQETRHEHGPCDNFRQTIRQYPDLAKILMDKCVTPVRHGSNLKNYNFRLMEDSYYLTTEDTDSRETKLVNDNFDPFTETGVLKPGAKEFTSDSVKWMDQHPVHLMVKRRCLNLLKHPLIDGWMSYKWSAYLKFIYFIIIALQIILSAFLILFLVNIPNWKDVSARVSNMPQEISCQDFNGTNDTYITSIREKYCSFLIYHILLFLATLTVFCLEIFRFSKMPKNYFRDLTHPLRLLCTIFAFVLLIPYESCWTLIKPAIPWQFGVMSFMLSSICLMNTLNKLPSFAFLSNITHQFIRSYLKGLFLISIIIFTFACSFYLLMQNDGGFKNIFNVIIKTVVWVLGDLAYDDTFGNRELTYPFLTMFLYLGFICMVGAFIISLIKAPSVDPHTVAYNKVAPFIMFMLSIDVCLSKQRRRYVVGKYRDEESYSCIRKLEDWWIKKPRSSIHKIIIPLTKNTALMDIPTRRRPWLIEKMERIANFCSTFLDKGDSSIPSELQEILEPQTAKLDQLLTICKKLMHNYQVQNEQIIELKQTHNEQITELKQTLNEQIIELKQTHNEKITELKQQIDTLMTSLKT